MLGHKHIDIMLLHIQFDKALSKQHSDEFMVNVATKPGEINALFKVGFEWVGEKDRFVYLRKRE